MSGIISHIVCECLILTGYGHWTLMWSLVLLSLLQVCFGVFIKRFREHLIHPLWRALETCPLFILVLLVVGFTDSRVICVTYQAYAKQMGLISVNRVRSRTPLMYFYPMSTSYLVALLAFQYRERFDEFFYNWAKCCMTTYELTNFHNHFYCLIYWE